MTASHENESELERRRAIDRCHAEIAAIEALLLAGHQDVEGLCMALSDWSAELRLVESEPAHGSSNRRREASSDVTATS